MPSLIYAPVAPTQTFLNIGSKLTTWYLIGVPAPGVRDGHLHGPHCSSTVYHEAKTLQLHLREPNHREATIWHEGM